MLGYLGVKHPKKGCSGIPPRAPGTKKNSKGNSTSSVSRSEASGGAAFLCQRDVLSWGSVWERGLPSQIGPVSCMPEPYGVLMSLVMSNADPTASDDGEMVVEIEDRQDVALAVFLGALLSYTDVEHGLNYRTKCVPSLERPLAIPGQPAETISEEVKSEGATKEAESAERKAEEGSNTAAEHTSSELDASPSEPATAGGGEPHHSPPPTKWTICHCAKGPLKGVDRFIEDNTGCQAWQLATCIHQPRENPPWHLGDPSITLKESKSLKGRTGANHSHVIVRGVTERFVCGVAGLLGNLPLLEILLAPYLVEAPISLLGIARTTLGSNIPFVIQGALVGQHPHVLHWLVNSLIPKYTGRGKEKKNQETETGDAQNEEEEEYGPTHDLVSEIVSQYTGPGVTIPFLRGVLRPVSGYDLALRGGVALLEAWNQTFAGNMPRV